MLDRAERTHMLFRKQGDRRNGEAAGGDGEKRKRWRSITVGIKFITKSRAWSLPQTMKNEGYSKNEYEID